MSRRKGQPHEISIRADTFAKLMDHCKASGQSPEQVIANWLALAKAVPMVKA